MANAEDVLLEALQDLKSKELKSFTRHLTNGVGRFERIPRGQLENADSEDIVEKMVDNYAISGAIEATLTILKKIRKNRLVEELKTKLSDGGTGRGQGESSAASSTTPTAGLSCGHKIDPQILKQDCYRQLNEGASELTCPDCKTELSYPEVRNYIKLNSEEKRFFEIKLDDNSRTNPTKACPGCHFFIEKADKNNLCVKCTVCYKEFCFQCLREWRGPRPRSDRCDNPGCPTY